MIEIEDKICVSNNNDSFVTEDAERPCSDGENHDDVSEKELDSNSYLFDTWSLRVELLCLKESIHEKSSILSFKNWIDVSLTLNGRDKITKIIQYSARLIAYYFESLAASMFSNDIQKGIFNARAKKFRSLQRALTSSRKAYRLGRTIIEIEKLNSMGIFYLMSCYIRQAAVSLYSKCSRRR